ncbi:MAG: glycerophosphodiester phosphodiesterase family protein [Myxococcota bacterium]
MTQTFWPTKPFILAHRGARSLATENTIDAFMKAIELGADGIECDVFLSQDGIPVVIHDETLDRTTSGHGFVWDHTAKDLSGLGVPTLQQTLECMPNGDVVNIELKSSQPFPASHWITIIEDLMNQHCRLRFILSSFDPTLLEGWGVSYPIGLLFDSNQPVQIPTTFNPDALHLDPSLIPSAPAGYKIVLWTAQSLEDARRWLADGADGVIAEF